MPGIQRLHLEEALEDSPRTHHLLNVFEKDVTQLKQYTTQLHVCCQRIRNAQSELASATQALSQHLMAYEKQNFALNDDNSILASSLKQFSSYIDDLSSMHHVFAQQMSDNMMYPLTRFIQADIEDTFTMSNMYHFTSNEANQALCRYMKLPKKKDNEKLRAETNEELYAMRKKFHQTSLHYYAALNSLQYKRKCDLLQPLIGLFQSQQSYIQMCNDAICRKEITDFLENITSSIQEVKNELTVETQKTVALIDTLERQESHLYSVEPTGDMPYIPPNTTQSQKSGYMFMRSRKMLTFTWERFYFFVQGGNLMVQKKSELAGSLLIDLSEPGLQVEHADSDDRRFVFQLLSPFTKKTVILQAENERDRDEWIHTMRNVIEEELMREKRSPKASHHGATQSKSQRSKSSSEAVTIPAMQHKRPSHGSIEPQTPPSTPTETFFMDTPIQFDMISPNISQDLADPADGPPKRINPFDQPSDTVQHSGSTPGTAFSQMFTVRFCGSMEVRTDRGEKLVHATIRRIMAARAIHNIFKMTESKFLVSSDAMRLLDPATLSLRLEFSLEDISYWSPHQENKRLFGFITRSHGQNGPSFACHVFESDLDAEEICTAIGTATTIAFQSMLEKKAKQSKARHEKDLLLYNISHLPDKDIHDANDIIPESTITSNDLALTEGASREVAEGLGHLSDPKLDPPSDECRGDGGTDSDLNPPSSECRGDGRVDNDLNPPSNICRGDGDERQIEGAECRDT